MDTIWIIIMCVLTAVTLGSAGYVVYMKKKANPEGSIGDARAEAWPSIRNIMSEFFTYFIEIAQIDKTDYQAAEDFAVNWIMKKISECSFLTEDEKAMITRQLVVALVRPRLQELCKADTPVPNEE